MPSSVSLCLKEKSFSFWGRAAKPDRKRVSGQRLEIRHSPLKGRTGLAPRGRFSEASGIDRPRRIQRRSEQRNRHRGPRGAKFGSSSSHCSPRGQLPSNGFPSNPPGLSWAKLQAAPRRRERHPHGGEQGRRPARRRRGDPWRACPGPLLGSTQALRGSVRFAAPASAPAPGPGRPFCKIFGNAPGSPTFQPSDSTRVRRRGTGKRGQPLRRRNANRGTRTSAGSRPGRRRRVLTPRVRRKSGGASWRRRRGAPGGLVGLSRSQIQRP